ncbi:hypothetical protein BGX38DRAFT_1142200 [Terfezia claveryi]|nr:hypothetical protein BGX38DRAFT_1142200 [Terfezia claveryi]
MATSQILTFLSEDDNNQINSDSDTADSTYVIALGLGKNTRAFSSIPDQYQHMTSIARTVVKNYTMYWKPFLTPGEMLLLLQSAWNKVQGNRYIERIKQVDTYVILAIFCLWALDY